MYVQPIRYESTRRDNQLSNEQKQEIAQKLYARGFLCAFVPQCRDHNEMLVVRNTAPLHEKADIGRINETNQYYTECFTRWRDSGGPGGVDNLIECIARAGAASLGGKEDPPKRARSTKVTRSDEDRYR